MEPMDESSGGASERWRNRVAVDEGRGVWLVEEAGQDRLVWLFRLNETQRADARLLDAIAAHLVRLGELREPQLGAPITGDAELRGAGEIGFAVPPGKLWGDAFPLGTRTPWAEAKPWALSLARLLETAARHGLIDGSLHPGRVWLTEDGRILAPGFALGPLLDPAAQGDVRQIWFSPQAVDGYPVTAADDRYSAAALIYQMVTGNAPLDPDNLVYEIRYAVPKTPESAGARIPAKASEVLMACLEKAPTKRPGSVAALLAGWNTVDAPAPQRGKTFTPAEFDPSLSQAASLPPPRLAPMRPAFLRPEVWFATFVMLAALGIGGWMLWVSWPKTKGPLDPNSEEALIAKGRELDAEMLRAAAASGATNGMVDIQALTNVAGLAAPTILSNAVAAPAPTNAPSAEDRQRDEMLRRESERRAAEIIAEARRLAEEKLRAERDAAEKLRQTETAKEESKFVPVFNGQDLAGWTGDTAYWSVQGGTLTGWIGGDAPPGTIGWLTSSQPAAGDFELRGQFRMRLLRDNRAGSAAIIYRGTAGGRDGYHFLLGFDPAVVGSVVGNSGRGMIAQQGQMTELGESPTARPVASDLPGVEAARRAIRLNDWNEFRITARGDTITHEINGKVVAVLRDKSSVRPRSGTFALRVGGASPACVVQFRELKLRRE